MANKVHKRKYGLEITIDPNMRDYSKDPYFIEKAEKARAFIAKHGLPGQPPSKTKSQKK